MRGAGGCERAGTGDHVVCPAAKGAGGLGATQKWPEHTRREAPACVRLVLEEALAMSPLLVRFPGALVIMQRPGDVARAVPRAPWKRIGSLGPRDTALRE